MSSEYNEKNHRFGSWMISSTCLMDQGTALLPAFEADFGTHLMLSITLLFDWSYSTPQD